MIYCKAMWGGYFVNKDSVSLCCGDNNGFMKKCYEVDPNDEFYRNIRQGIATGNIPDYCKKCTAKNGYDIISNVNKGFISNKHSMTLNGSIPNYKITNMTYMVTDKCNSACKMCSATCSTLHQNFDDTTEEKFDEEFEFNRFKDLYGRNRDTISNLSLLGGEVFISNYLERYLDEVDESCCVLLYTNGLTYDIEHIKKLKKFQSSIIVFSIDGDGYMNEYIRPNCKIDKVMENLKKMKEELGDKTTIVINSTFTAYNISYIKNLYDFLFESDKWIDHYSLNLVNNIDYMGISNLNSEESEIVEDSIFEILTSDRFMELSKFKIEYMRRELNRIMFIVKEQENYSIENKDKLEDYRNKHDSFFKLNFDNYKR